MSPSSVRSTSGRLLLTPLISTLPLQTDDARLVTVTNRRPPRQTGSLDETEASDSAPRNRCYRGPARRITAYRHPRVIRIRRPASSVPLTVRSWSERNTCALDVPGDLNIIRREREQHALHMELAQRQLAAAENAEAAQEAASLNRQVGDLPCAILIICKGAFRQIDRHYMIHKLAVAGYDPAGAVIIGLSRSFPQLQPSAYSPARRYSFRWRCRRYGSFCPPR